MKFTASYPLLSLLAVPALVAAAPASASLSAVSAHLKAVNTMTADFVQTDRSGKAVKGKLTLKRPGHIRFQYEKGVPLLIVGDGRALTMIDYSVRQVSRWPVKNSPLSILTNPDPDLGRYARMIPSGKRNALVMEAKDPKHPEFGTITIAFSKNPAAPGGLTLDGWTVLDAQGNRSAVHLSNQKFNRPVDDRAFRWEDPRPKGPRR